MGDGGGYGDGTAAADGGHGAGIADSIRDWERGGEEGGAVRPAGGGRAAEGAGGAMGWGGVVGAGGAGRRCRGEGWGEVLSPSLGVWAGSGWGGGPRGEVSGEEGRGTRRARSSFGFPLPPLKFRTVGFPQYGFKWTVSGDLRRHPRA